MEYELNQHRIASFAELQKRLADTEFRLERDIRALRLAPSSTGVADSDTFSGSEPAVALEKDFYHRFEEHFRGPEALVSERLSFYLPLIEEKLDKSLKALPCVDIGCGRGEWLELLREAGYTGKGIDLDLVNIEGCTQRGFDVELGDGLSWLRSAASNTLALISAFHVIEHLPFNVLNQLLAECLRTLSPGGIIIFETPNPENLNTAAHQFYIDPTHRKPVPPVLLEFLADYSGFSDVELHRLHPVREPGASEEDQQLIQMLYGPRDYAILARKR